MFHSIRWRLVATFTLLTLLTVMLLGITVLTLIRHTLQQRASAELKANAEAVAQQSGALFQPEGQPTGLYQLAYAAAFLGDAQVRILDEQNQVLVDSGSPAAMDEFTWLTSPPAAAPHDLARELTLIMRAPPPPAAAWLTELPRLADPSADGAEATAGLLMVRKLPGPWGDRLFFHSPLVTEQLVISGATQVYTPTWAMGAAAPVAFTLSPIQVTAPIQADGQVVGYVEMTNAPNLLEATLAVIRRAFLLAAGAVTALAIGVGLVVSRGLTAPLASLTTATNRMNSGDLSTRAPVHGRDEIGLLARQFNQMAAALEQTFGALAQERDALRRFIADASHELRTPITALRTFNELLQGPASQTDATRTEFLQESASQINRLERITEQLLNLSRLEGGLAPSALAQHDLCEIVTTTVAALRTVAQERAIALQVELPPQPLLVQVDRRQLETALTNLLDNALKFTPPAGQIQVGSAQREQQVELWVKDNGCGIAADELPYIFERFHRGRQAGSTGSGLGLAIVQSIVQAHHGRIEVVSQPGLGSRFTIILPNSP